MSTNTRLDRRAFLRTSLLTGAALGASLRTGGLAWAEEAAAAPSGDEVLKNLLEGNARYARGESNLARYGARASMAGGQSPRAIILGCADSRVPPEIIFDQDRGELFVVRIAGNFLERDGLASIEYAVKVLGSSLIMVLGHSKCGAVDAAIKYVKEGAELPGHLPDLVKEIRPAVAKAKGEPGNMLANTITANALRNARKVAEAEPIVAPRARDGSVKVVAAVYDLETGRVTLKS